MRFSVFALSSAPDTASARTLYDVADLDDKSVAKILFHQRKQQTGSSEDLRWDQRAIVSLTMLHHTVDQVSIETMSIDSHSEDEMLHAFYRAVLRNAQAVSWDGARDTLPLLHFRSLKHQVSYPAYWHAMNEGIGLHVDLQNWLAPPNDDQPSLDMIARRLGFPGMLDHREDEIVTAWLDKDYARIRAYSDLSALNTYLLAVRIFSVNGEMTSQDAVRVHKDLRKRLARVDEPHMSAFLAAWGDR